MLWNVIENKILQYLLEFDDWKCQNHFENTEIILKCLANFKMYIYIPFFIASWFGN